MRMVEALVKKSDSQITDSASILQKIVAASADERGEWHLPLSDESVSAMRQVRIFSHEFEISCIHRTALFPVKPLSWSNQASVFLMDC